MVYQIRVYEQMHILTFANVLVGYYSNIRKWLPLCFCFCLHKLSNRTTLNRWGKLNILTAILVGGGDIFFFNLHTFLSEL